MSAVGQQAHSVGLVVDLDPEGPRKLEREIRDSGALGFPVIGYFARPEGRKLFVVPKLKCSNLKDDSTYDYLPIVERGGPLSPIHWSGEYCVSFPILDLKLVNNGKKNLSLNRVEIAVSESTVDLAPFPTITDGVDHTLHFGFRNEGWGSVESCVVRFKITPKKVAPGSGSLPYSRTVTFTAGSADIDTSAELSRLGVSPAYIQAVQDHAKAREIENETSMALSQLETTDPNGRTEKTRKTKAMHDEASKKSSDLYSRCSAMTSDPAKRRKSLGPFAVGGREGEDAYVSGFIDFAWKDAQGALQQKSYSFVVPMELVLPEGLGAPGPVSGNYQAMLKREGTNYTLPVTINQSLRAGKSTHFTLKLGVPCTGRHEFVVKVLASSGEIIESGPIVLRGLLPKSAADELAREAGSH